MSVRAYIWVIESISCIVALEAMKQGPKHSSVFCWTGLKAALGSRHLAVAALLIEVHQQLKVWRIQGAPVYAATLVRPSELLSVSSNALQFLLHTVVMTGMHPQQNDAQPRMSHLAIIVSYAAMIGNVCGCKLAISMQRLCRSKQFSDNIR